MMIFVIAVTSPLRSSSYSTDRSVDPQLALHHEEHLINWITLPANVRALIVIAAARTSTALSLVPSVSHSPTL
ncbi:hypothetical protein CICLE_v10006375mg [Citrus x clementina]|uniref:Uncharacterized protein n=1 Tax=Citrus clementina TaxID=85681 RepID=V4SEH6_CITCL|nr:hypothetical protein CICLE_v10006375mg [Citrus x clementina]